MSSFPFTLCYKEVHTMLTVSCLSLILSLAPLAEDEKPYRSQKRQFLLPVMVDKARADELEEIQLFASWDKGKTWKKVQSVKPTDQKTMYTAPQDGEVWFTLRT